MAVVIIGRENRSLIVRHPFKDSHDDGERVVRFTIPQENFASLGAKFDVTLFAMSNGQTIDMYPRRAPLGATTKASQNDFVAMYIICTIAIVFDFGLACVWKLFRARRNTSIAPSIAVSNPLGQSTPDDQVLATPLRPKMKRRLKLIAGMILAITVHLLALWSIATALNSFGLKNPSGIRDLDATHLHYNDKTLQVYTYEAIVITFDAEGVVKNETLATSLSYILMLKKQDLRVVHVSANALVLVITMNSRMTPKELDVRWNGRPTRIHNIQNITTVERLQWNATESLSVQTIVHLPYNFSTYYSWKQDDAVVATLDVVGTAKTTTVALSQKNTRTIVTAALTTRAEEEFIDDAKSLTTWFITRNRIGTIKEVCSNRWAMSHLVDHLAGPAAPISETLSDPEQVVISGTWHHFQIGSVIRNSTLHMISSTSSFNSSLYSKYTNVTANTNQDDAFKTIADFESSSKLLRDTGRCVGEIDETFFMTASIIGEHVHEPEPPVEEQNEHVKNARDSALATLAQLSTMVNESSGRRRAQSPHSQEDDVPPTAFAFAFPVNEILRMLTDWAKLLISEQAMWGCPLCYRDMPDPLVDENGNAKHHRVPMQFEYGFLEGTLDRSGQSIKFCPTPDLARTEFWPGCSNHSDSCVYANDGVCDEIDDTNFESPFVLNGGKTNCATNIDTSDCHSDGHYYEHTNFKHYGTPNPIIDVKFVHPMTATVDIDGYARGKMSAQPAYCPGTKGKTLIYFCIVDHWTGSMDLLVSLQFILQLGVSDSGKPQITKYQAFLKEVKVLKPSFSFGWLHWALKIALIAIIALLVGLTAGSAGAFIPVVAAGGGSVTVGLSVSGTIVGAAVSGAIAFSAEAAIIAAYGTALFDEIFFDGWLEHKVVDRAWDDITHSEFENPIDSSTVSALDFSDESSPDSLSELLHATIKMTLRAFCKTSGATAALAVNNFINSHLDKVFNVENLGTWKVGLHALRLVSNEHQLVLEFGAALENDDVSQYVPDILFDRFLAVHDWPSSTPDAFDLSIGQNLINNYLSVWWGTRGCSHGCQVDGPSTLDPDTEILSLQPPKIYFFANGSTFEWRSALTSPRWLHSSGQTQLIFRFVVAITGFVMTNNRLGLEMDTAAVEIDVAKHTYPFVVDMTDFSVIFNGAGTAIPTELQPILDLSSTYLQPALSQTIGPLLNRLRTGCLIPVIPIPMSTLVGVDRIETTFYNGAAAVRLLFRGRFWGVLACTSHLCDSSQSALQELQCPVGTAVSSVLFYDDLAHPSDTKCCSLDHVVALEQAKLQATCGVVAINSDPVSHPRVDEECFWYNGANSLILDSRASRDPQRLPGQCPDDYVVAAVESGPYNTGYIVIQCCKITDALIDYGRMGRELELYGPYGHCSIRLTSVGGTAMPVAVWPSRCVPGHIAVGYETLGDTIVVTKCCPVRSTANGCPSADVGIACAGRGSCLQRESSIGECICDPGFAGPACTFVCEVDQFGTPCGGHGFCTTTGCMCQQGYAGSACDIPFCELPCVHGSCEIPNFCTCEAGYSGRYCNIPVQCADPEYMCWMYQLGNGFCDTSCWTSTCGDPDCEHNGGAGHCPCSASLLHADPCHPACQVPACMSQAGVDCTDGHFCTPLCPGYYRGDGICDHVCNSARCDFDNDDCENNGGAGLEEPPTFVPPIAPPKTTTVIARCTTVQFAMTTAYDEHPPDHVVIGCSSQSHWILQAQHTGRPYTSSDFPVVLDSHAVVYTENTTNAIIVAFRGTDDTPVWVLNVLGTIATQCRLASNCGRVHTGFQDMVLSLAAQLTQTLEDLESRGFGSELYLTGHSLGGALAQMYAMVIGSAPRRRHIHVSAFGMPKFCVDEHCVARYNEFKFETELIVEMCAGQDDIFATLPPSALGYRHTVVVEMIAVPSTVEFDITCHKQYAHAVSSQCNQGSCLAINCQNNLWRPPGAFSCEMCPQDCGIGRYRDNCRESNIGVCLSCDPPPRFAHHIADANCTFSCDDGYTQSNGICVANECHSGNMISNSSTSCVGYTGDRCEYRCANGFDGEGSHVCDYSGSFSGGYCRAKSCTRTAILNSDRAAPGHQCDGFTGSVCVYRCNQGYTASKNLAVRCTADGIFEQAHCSPNSCAPYNIENSNHGERAPCTGTTGEQCQYDCDKGYTGTSIVTCQADGTFTIAACMANACEPYPIANSTRAGRGSECHGATTDVCSYECLLGYSDSGGGQVACRSDGSFEQARCSPNSCAPYMVANSDKLGHQACTGITGDWCVYLCNTGYNAQHGRTSVAICRPNGLFSEAICGADMCEPYPIANSTRAGRGSECHGATTHVCSYECLPGYSDSGGGQVA
jgi:hypothetical protein